MKALVVRALAACHSMDRRCLGGSVICPNIQKGPSAKNRQRRPCHATPCYAVLCRGRRARGKKGEGRGGGGRGTRRKRTTHSCVLYLLPSWWARTGRRRLRTGAASEPRLSRDGRHETILGQMRAADAGKERDSVANELFVRFGWRERVYSRIRREDTRTMG